MIIPQGYEYNHDKEISNEEYEVINKFLEINLLLLLMNIGKILIWFH